MTRYPQIVPEIPPSWWDDALDGQVRKVDLSTLADASIFSFKQACYRNAALRSRKVTLYHPIWNTIYIQAYPLGGIKPTRLHDDLSVPAPWPDLGPNIPFVAFPAKRQEVITLDAQQYLSDDALAFLKAGGWTLEVTVKAPTERQEAAALAAEIEEIKTRCNCGTQDFRFHEPSCHAWA